ncbi:VOC family protein [Pseudoalteromonas sp. SS15]|uniref:VOC family protein n=1 Tax=Pseudoalteromonas sp. SS15 TaxID=3139393 RepID=UPI003BAA190D
MAKLTSSPISAFCWAELCSSDWAGGKQFYTQLFDWQFDDQPIGEDCYYTMLKKQADDVAAMYQMMPEQKEANIPSHWLGYIAVKDVDAIADKAKQLGATVIHGPCDVMSAGRMVMISDPGGAFVAFWQANEHIGTQRILEKNTPYWHELACRGSEKIGQFYSELLGWQIQVEKMEHMDYTLFCNEQGPVAGMLEMTEEWEGIPPHWMIYFAVADCDAMSEKSTSLGGQVCVPPTDIPNIGRFAVITDPQGAVFSIMQSCNGDIDLDA